MDYKKILKLLKNFPHLILNYEDGDLLLLSDLIEQIKQISLQLKKSKEAQAILNILSNIINSLLKGNNINNFIDIFSSGIDLINRLVKELEQQSSGKKKKINKLLLSELDNFKNEYNIYNKKNDLILKKNKRDKKTKTNQKNETITKFMINSESFKIFLVEADDKLIRAQELILKMEKDLSNEELLHELFRIFHTIKGECGFLKLDSLGELTHNLENLMDCIRDNKLENSTDIIDILFNGIDYALKMLSALKKGDIVSYNNVDISNYIDEVNTHIHKFKKSIGEILEEEGKLSKAEVEKILEKQKELSYTKKFGEIAIENNFITQEEMDKTLNEQKSSEKEKIILAEKADQIIKVKASQINYLVDMVGELLIAENQLEDKNILQLKKITREIQNAAMKLRTIKIKNLFINIRRIIRDLSKQLKKDIVSEIYGENQEIDRNIVESLEEPLIHIIRNAIGHGIESKNERIKKGKDPLGTIILKAERRGNNIVITVKDDGKGLNKEKILKKALTKKLIDKSKINLLTDTEIFNFIFLPGFSTAKVVDTISGRGVGMDVVKKNVASLRGDIEIQSELDLYTEISLIFPLSMAIIDGMIVKSGNTPFIIPVNNIIESLKVENEMIHSIEKKAKVLNLREEIIPIIDLKDYFFINNKENNLNSIIMAVIVESNKRKYALLLDEVISKKEIVVKPLGKKFQNLNGIASGTVLAGGKVGFVLNIEEIVDFIDEK